jgi:membrane-associated phospholipid phosphatase
MDKFLSGIFSNYDSFLYSLGYFGEYITFLITCALIFNQHVYFIVYIIVFILNRLVNNYLKQIFKQDRPKNPKKFLDDDQFSKKKYGMPSGHTQLTFFSVMYAYLVTNKFYPWILLLLSIAIIVIYERLVFRNHTLAQLISGALFGSIIAYLSYSLVGQIKM